MGENILELVIYKISLIIVILLILGRYKIFKNLLQKKEYSKLDLNIIGIIFGIISIISVYGKINVYGAVSATRNIAIVSATLLFGRRAGIISLMISLIFRFSANIYTISIETEIAQLLLVTLIAIILQPKIKEGKKAIAGVGICTSSVIIVIIYIYTFKSNDKLLMEFMHQFTLPAIISQLGIGLFIHVVEDIINQKTISEQEKEIEKLKTKISKSELKALQAQINPHFLFNTLNAISILTKRDPDKARRVIYDLSHYLRYNLELKSGLININKEIEQTKKYLEIEQVRFKNKLEIIYDVDEDVDVKIPSLIIQPIVENALVHGILKSQTKGLIKISVKQNKDITNVCIENKGIPIENKIIEEINNGNVEENKIGLYNVHCRLKYQYGQGLKITRLEDGTKVEFQIGGD